MGRIKKFPGLDIKKITGGKDPVRLISEFISRCGFDPEETQKEKTADHVRWMLNISDDEQLEVLVESLKVPAETTVYMGINIATVPIRSSQDVLVTALEIADGLVGIKISLVGHFLVLSSSVGLSGINVDDLTYNYKLILAQKDWFKEAMATELEWDLWGDT